MVQKPTRRETLRIARLGRHGDGIAGVEGLRVFVPYVLPGEVVAAELRGERGRVLDVLEPSPDRVEPPCPHFGRCGGCALQHAPQALVADFKRDLIVTALRHRRIEAEVAPTVDAHGKGRRRVTLHARRRGSRFEAGFMRARSDRLEPIATCPLLVPDLADAPRLASRLAEPLAAHGRGFEVRLTATATGLDADVHGKGAEDAADDLGARNALTEIAAAADLARLTVGGETIVARREPTVRIGDADVVPPPGSFLQATDAGEAALAAEVLKACSGARRVADLFAGIGPFALRLARAAEVLAIDSDAQAIRALARPAGRAGYASVTTETRDLFRRPLSADELRGFDAVIFDPPRAGAEAQARELARSSVPVVVAVSCDPATFARDAATLLAGGYEAERITPIDQFRWSAHVEIVGVFRRG